MQQPKELEWNRMFAYDLPARQPSKIPHDCCDACKEAREIKCVCACGGKNHGAALKKDVERLDKFTDAKDVEARYLEEAALDTIPSEAEIREIDKA